MMARQRRISLERQICSLISSFPAISFERSDYATVLDDGIFSHRVKVYQPIYQAEELFCTADAAKLNDLLLCN